MLQKMMDCKLLRVQSASSIVDGNRFRDSPEQIQRARRPKNIEQTCTGRGTWLLRGELFAVPSHAVEDFVRDVFGETVRQLRRNVFNHRLCLSG